MTYKDYTRAMEDNKADFAINIAQFCYWLDETEKRVNTFLSSFEELKKGIINVYDLCIDYSIPMVMVKYFLTREYFNEIDIRIFSIPVWK